MDPKSGIDNIDQAASVDQGYPSWHTWNVSFNYKFHPNAALSLALNNILDLHYRTFNSGVSAAGRNLILSMRWNN